MKSLILAFLFLISFFTYASDEWSEERLFQAFSSDTKIPLLVVYNTLQNKLGSSTLKAYAATYLGTHGNNNSIEILINSLFDNSVHMGARYKDPGLNSTRYRAYLSLKRLTHQNFPFEWKAAETVRVEQAKQWRRWYNEDLKDIKYLKKQILKANYCNSTSDCVRTITKCPLGCNLYVHKDELKRIDKLLELFKVECKFQCVKVNGVSCIKKQCSKNESVPSIDLSKDD